MKQNRFFYVYISEVKYMYEIKKKNFSIQPRERLLEVGVENLSEQELLAILLRTGSRGEAVTELAGKILKRFGSLSNLRRASISEFKMIKGIGIAKAAEIQAMIELGKRVQAANPEYHGKVMRSEDFGRQMITELSGYEQEHLLAFYLDNRNRILKRKVIFIGTVNSAPAVPRDILAQSVRIMATGIVVVHNHPSGNPDPSEADIAFTHDLNQSCRMLGSTLVDHLIVGRDRYYSFRERNRL